MSGGCSAKTVSMSTPKSDQKISECSTRRSENQAKAWKNMQTTAFSHNLTLWVKKDCVITRYRQLLLSAQVLQSWFWLHFLSIQVLYYINTRQNEKWKIDMDCPDIHSSLLDICQFDLNVQTVILSFLHPYCSGGVSTVESLSNCMLIAHISS